MLLWFLLTLGLAIVSIVMISRIIAKLAFLEAATNYTFEIQQARRFEKNYFLYGTNLADALEHVHNARGILEAQGRNIVAVIGQPAFDVMAANLGQYEALLSRLREEDQGRPARAGAAPLTGSRPKGDFRLSAASEIETRLREHGAEMVAVAEDLVVKERKSVSSIWRCRRESPWRSWESSSC